MVLHTPVICSIFICNEDWKQETVNYAMMCGNSLKGETDRYLSIISAQDHILKTLKNQKWGGPLEFFVEGGSTKGVKKGSGAF